MSASAPLFIQPAFLPRPTLEALAELLRTSEGEPAGVQPEPGARLDVVREVRRAWEIDVSDEIHDTLVTRIEQLRARLEAWFEERLDPCDAVAVLRYPTGAFYRTHRDISRHPDRYGLHRRAVSIVIFLNSAAPLPDAGFTGGLLRLAETPDDDELRREVVPEAGTLVAFRSDLLHEVTPVASGTRGTAVTWLLRRQPPAGPAGPTTRPGAA